MTTFVANISKAAETRQVMVGGVPTFVTDFNVAENYRSSNGERATQFYRVSLWRDAGTKMAKYLTLGRPILIEGRVKARAYIDKNGQPQANLEIANPRIQFITANNAGETETTADPEDLPFPAEE
jgi:single-strand DNA-binding protein